MNVEPPVFYGLRKSCRSAKPYTIDPTEHIGLAWTLAKQFGADPRAVADSWQYSDALMALVRAAQDFDPSRGVRFSTFATLYMRGDLCERLKSLAREKRAGAYKNASLSVLAKAPSGNGSLTLGDVVLAYEDAYSGDDREQLEHWMGRLDERTRRMVRAYYFEGKTFAAIAQREGVSKQRVLQIVEKALAVMRRAAMAA